jgi:hypothetical protein
MQKQLSRQACASVVLLWCLVASACASSGTLRLAIASDQLASSTERLQTQVIELRNQNVITAEDFGAWQRRFAKIAKVGLALNEALRKSDGRDTIDQIRAFIDLLDELVAEQVVKVPQQSRLALTIVMESIRATLLTLSVSAGGA